MEIANRCGYILQQADGHLSLGKIYRDTAELEKVLDLHRSGVRIVLGISAKSAENFREKAPRKSREHASLAKLRARQRIDVDTGDYVTNEEDNYIYKLCFEKANKLIESLGV